MNSTARCLNVNDNKDNEIGLKVNSFSSGRTQLRLGSTVSVLNVQFTFFFSMIIAFLPKPFVPFHLLDSWLNVQPSSCI